MWRLMDGMSIPKNESLAWHCGILVGAEEEGVDELIMGLDGMNL